MRSGNGRLPASFLATRDKATSGGAAQQKMTCGRHNPRGWQRYDPCEKNRSDHLPARLTIGNAYAEQRAAGYVGGRYRQAPLGRENYHETGDQVSPESVIAFHPSDFLTDRLCNRAGV